MRAETGDSALVYAAVLGAFHYINRIADLLHVESELLPAPLLRFEALRRIGIRLGSTLLARMDLANRRYAQGYDETCAQIAPLLPAGIDAAKVFEPLGPRPWLIEVLRHSLEERRRSSLAPEQALRVHDLVERALPRSAEEATGFHPRPRGAVEAFAFVGTRYPARTTRQAIDELRAEGFDDLGILDLAHAVADANQWARMHRLLGLPRAVLASA